MSTQTPFGYKQDPNNRNHLIIDDEAAEIVRMIFELAEQGNSYLSISRKLTELGIITPAAYKVKNGDTRFIRCLNKEEALTTWSYQTVRTILLDSVYRGDMVNHKTEIINYKTKERVSIPIDEYIIVPNRHEAIIDNETFEKVQKILQARKRNKRHNFENVFKGIVYCAECGTAMNLISKNTRKGEKRALFKCFKHYEEPEQCKHYHAILYDELYNEVLTRIKLLFQEIRSSRVYENLYRNLIEQKTAEMAEQEKEEILKELSSVKKSISNIRKTSNDLIFDDTLLDELVFKQRELTQRLALIECGEIDYAVDENEIDELLNKILNFEKLDEGLVSKLIKRIEIGEVVVTELGPQRDIIITYSFKAI